MLRSYFLSTLRAIRKSPVSSFINIFGLATALGVSIMVYAFIDFDLSMDQFHENKEEIYLVTTYLERNNEVFQHGIVPPPLAEVLKNDFPQIEKMTRVEDRTGILKSGINVFNQEFRFVDPAFLEMFTFPLAYGNAEALNDANKIILSHETAIKYFGEENALGKAMTFDFEGRKYTFEVGGVAEPFPRRSSMAFEVLVQFDQIKAIDADYTLDNWARFLDAVFVQTADEKNMELITTQIQTYTAEQNEARDDWVANEFSFIPWTELIIKGENLSSRITGEADALARQVLLIIGSFVLILAVFNYINIAIVSASKRLKEIGVRKVMGGTRSSLIWQFLTENVILTFLALIIGYVLAITLFIPGFDQLFDIQMDFQVNQPQLYVFLIILVFITGLLSGAYPALYISKFNAVNIFRGRLKFGGKNRLTKVFLTFQYILAVIAVVGGILFTQNTIYQKNMDWGYDQNNVISAYLNDSDQVRQLQTAMDRNAKVEMTTASYTQLNRSTSSKIIEVGDQTYDIPSMIVEENYLETLGLQLIEGRNFDKNLENDFNNVLVNEKLAKVIDLESAIGKQFKVDSLQYTVIGIVEDFHQWSFFDAIEPMFIRLAKEDEYRYFTMKVSSGNLQSGMADLENTWAELFPEKPFDGYYQETSLDWYFKNIDGHSKLMQTVAAICIMLSCLGLYGLVSLNVASRVKEFSIRKALGARLKNLVYVINKQFVIYLSISLILGIPLSFVLLSNLFESVYAMHVPITWLPFAIALGIVVIMVSITISSQIKKVMTTSPTEGLRIE